MRARENNHRAARTAAAASFLAASPMKYKVASANRSAYHLALTKGASPHSYPNVSIAGPGLRAIVYLPDAEHGYYRASRYDWGSMVGRIQLTAPNGGSDVTACVDVRPRPHRPLLTDHVLGFAAEFGCGVRGALCRDSHSHQLATNGVFGYGDAGKGGVFAKLGVGKLIRPCAIAEIRTHQPALAFRNSSGRM